ncbi:hypothetical protein [Gordonia polyisoprenivorans]|uniref:hypothetical protein n=1 Tax=Gordonia polyisoprenivorans TaxID=84595 RepID=UPI001AD7BD76|nr:hypothetical protein [Gordonia polyisoprenivorans]QTI69785.1 hypothetical protein J6U32_04045 [Gordonia polyisoprenivorans]
MDDHDDRETAMPRRVWQVLHVVATIAVPWAFAGYYLRSHQSSIIGAAHFVADYHVKAATAAGVLLASTALLRLFGRSVAATGPFAAMWAMAMAFAISQAREYGGEFSCRVELCMPDFGLFITAVPFAVVVSFAVIGSALINYAFRKNNRASPMTLQ